MAVLDKIDDFLTESSAMVMDRGKELSDLLSSDLLSKLNDAGMKTQKEAAKIFQQAIRILKGVQKEEHKKGRY